MADLTDKQAAFVREYPVDRNATQAAIRAGYSAKTANQAGSRLLANAKVSRAINEINAQAAENAHVTAQMVLNGLAREAQAGDPSEPNPARVRAWETLAKLLGMMIERRENREVTEFDGLSTAELEAKIEELKGSTKH